MDFKKCKGGPIRRFVTPNFVQAAFGFVFILFATT